MGFCDRKSLVEKQTVFSLNFKNVLLLHGAGVGESTCVMPWL